LKSKNKALNKGEYIFERKTVEEISYYLENEKYLSFQTRDSIQNILINVLPVTSGIQYFFHSQ
jgi:hypothetical protein